MSFGLTLMLMGPLIAIATELYAIRMVLEERNRVHEIRKALEERSRRG